MGFKAPRRTFRLTFDDPDLEGLEVRVGSLTYGQLRQIESTETRGEEAELTLQLFTSSLVDWNLEDDDGNPVPTTYEAMDDLDPVFLGQLTRAWLRGVVGVSADFERPSSDTQQPQEESLPMAPSTSPQQS